jgi:hypothetical protein
MSIAVGSDGSVKIDLGNGLEYVANITSWNLDLKRNALRQTDLSDEAERRTAGIADWTGDFQFNLQFSDDESVAQSAWQMLSFIFSGTGNTLKAQIELILQREQLPADDIFSTTISGVIKLVGTVVLEGVSLNCEDPERAVVAVARWLADGALALERE